MDLIYFKLAVGYFNKKIMRLVFIYQWIINKTIISFSQKRNKLILIEHYQIKNHNFLLDML